MRQPAAHVTIRNGQNEVKLTALSEQERTLFRRNHIGIVFQFFNLIPTLTVPKMSRCRSNWLANVAIYANGRMNAARTCGAGQSPE
jgi:predicted ABC-type transport system involved in lysophospholipase L1 biosynthesis ATPase subunit